MRALTPLEARVLGVLVEKQHTVPDTYPLSVNALTAGCNQKTARFPVIEATEAEVMTAVDGLKSLNEAWQLALVDLKWRQGETSDDYLTRTVTPYLDFEERIDGIKLIVETVRTHVKPLPAAPKAKAAASGAAKK